MGENVNTVAVIGAGAMGSQIAMVSALSGIRTYCYDISADALRKAEEWAVRYLEERVSKGKLTPERAEAARANLWVVGTLEEAARNADVVIEAVIEKLDVKRSVFTELDRICPPHSILATNSSTIVSSRIADATARPEKVLNMHFFNPALVMELVEVARHEKTSDEAVGVVMDLARRMGKTPVLLRKEISGFIVNFILDGMIRRACFLVEGGYASHEDVDVAVKKGLRHPMGPFELLDFTGIDVAYLVRMERCAESGREDDKPPRIIAEKYGKGEWGRKTGKGFYVYG